jgi:hypothetical protein
MYIHVYIHEIIGCVCVWCVCVWCVCVLVYTILGCKWWFWEDLHAVYDSLCSIIFTVMHQNCLLVGCYQKIIEYCKLYIHVCTCSVYVYKRICMYIHAYPFIYIYVPCTYVYVPFCLIIMMSRCTGFKTITTLAQIRVTSLSLPYKWVSFRMGKLPVQHEAFNLLLQVVGDSYMRSLPVKNLILQPWAASVLTGRLSQLEENIQILGAN